MTLAAIRWRWPGAQVVIRGEGDAAVLERWDGPGERPTDQEIAQAEVDYLSQGIAIREAAQTEMDRVVVKAMLLYFLRKTLGRQPTPEQIEAERVAFLQAFRDVSG